MTTHVVFSPYQHAYWAFRSRHVVNVLELVYLHIVYTYIKQCSGVSCGHLPFAVVQGSKSWSHTLHNEVSIASVVVVIFMMVICSSSMGTFRRIQQVGFEANSTLPCAMLECRLPCSQHEIAPVPCEQLCRRHRVRMRVVDEKKATWLILPVVICLSQRLSHACLSINAFIL